MHRRPVATPRALKNLTQAPDLSSLFEALPYYISNLQFPYDYDPIIADHSFTSPLTVDISFPRVVRTNHGNNSHIFDGNLLFTDDNVWQYCDISDDQLRRIRSTTTIRHSFCPRNGFFYNGTNAKLWEIMTDKVLTIQDGEEPAVDDYECLLDIPDDYKAGSRGRERKRYDRGFGQNYTRKQAFMRSLILKKAQSLEIHLYAMYIVRLPRKAHAKQLFLRVEDR
ncbi:hypothetical protein BDV41DRAFT_567139 [Aspergillus transmontanensis]|uniref:Transcription factor IIIC subunit 5 HTH domain-containing protein n=1 Tax=Aspergillus transmontanensis TaxID=1034304 RepID=A0A5N6VMB3_9EURO|nr:hypothetical protein BDV41DRAFT_567139 [Aspergillus transmontanensis]